MTTILRTDDMTKQRLHVQYLDSTIIKYARQCRTATYLLGLSFLIF